MSKLDPPPNAAQMPWGRLRDWLFKLWQSVTGATFGSDSSSYSAAIAALSAPSDGPSGVIGGNGSYINGNTFQQATAVGVSVPATTETPIVSMSLPSGTWYVQGNITFSATGGSATNAWVVSISLVSNGEGYNGFVFQGTISPGGQQIPVPLSRYVLTAPTTLYVVGQLNFVGGSCTASARIEAWPGV